MISKAPFTFPHKPAIRLFEFYLFTNRYFSRPAVVDTFITLTVKLSDGFISIQILQQLNTMKTSFMVCLVLKLKPSVNLNLSEEIIQGVSICGWANNIKGFVKQ